MGSRWTLICRFPRLFDITFTKQISLQEVKAGGPEVILFGRTLIDETADQWAQVLALLDQVTLSSDSDSVRYVNNRKMWAVRDPFKSEIFPLADD